MDVISEICLLIYEKYNDNLITEDEKNFLLFYINEKEEDHKMHMNKKFNAAVDSEKDLSQMHNKKYDKDKELIIKKSTPSMDEILHFMGKDTSKDKDGNYETPIRVSKQDLKYAEKEKSAYWGSRDGMKSLRELTAKDIIDINNALLKIDQIDKRRRSKLSKDEIAIDHKKHEMLQKFVSKKLFGKELSDFQKPFEPIDLRDKNGKIDPSKKKKLLEQFDHDKTPDGKYFDSNKKRTLYGHDIHGENKVKLPSGTWYTCSPRDGLTELQGSGKSNGKISNRNRIWISRNTASMDLYGKNVYKLLKVPEYGFYDHHDEGPITWGSAQHHSGLNQYYIEIDEPIPVVQVMCKDKHGKSVAVAGRTKDKETGMDSEFVVNDMLHQIYQAKRFLIEYNTTDDSKKTDYMNRKAADYIKKLDELNKKIKKIDEDNLKSEEKRINNLCEDNTNNKNAKQKVIGMIESLKNKTQQNMMDSVKKLKDDKKTIQNKITRVGGKAKGKLVHEYVDEKLQIYEAYRCGAITKEEKDEYLIFYS